MCGLVKGVAFCECQRQWAVLGGFSGN